MHEQGGPDQMKQPARSRDKWKGNIKLDIRETG
jgi:hypothetical protein